MKPDIGIRCPVCQHKETVTFTPSISISFDVEVEITYVDCSECGYDGEPWPFDDKCPECGGLVAGEVTRQEDAQPIEARLWCDGDSHLDDGTGCGHEWEWSSE